MSSKSKTTLYIALSVIAVLIFIIYRVVGSGITGPLDNKFGDQHLKTVVSLLEMHKLRNGIYPDSLSDLKYIGDWDMLGIQNVDYFVNCEHTKYYVEVSRGWVAKPNLVMDSGFWQGTGYSETLQKCVK